MQPNPVRGKARYMANDPSFEPSNRPPSRSSVPGPDPFETVQPQTSTPRPAGEADERIILMPGARPLPEYELVKPLGRGGFGEVWKASGPGGFALALKFIRLGERSGTVELRALELMKDIRHPHLLVLFGAWQRSGLLIIAMELAEGT